MTTRRPRVALVHISPSGTASFVQCDLDILEARYEVRPLRYRGWRDTTRLLRVIASSNVVVSWFAWDHALWAFRIAKALGKPSILITGGFDVVGLPDIGYGSLLHPSSAKRVRTVVRTATRVIAISNSIRISVSNFSNRSDIELIPLGFDPERIPFSAEKEPIVITVGSITASNLVRKGMETFIEIARSMPETQFALIGEIGADVRPDLRTQVPSNLHLTGHLPGQALFRWLQRAKVYVQLSAHEGFGAAVAEAMLAGCVPVVSDRGALPEVVGDAGLQVPWGDFDSARHAITIALGAPQIASIRSRNRIASLFPLDRRRDALLAAVGSLLKRDSTAA